MVEACHATLSTFEPLPSSLDINIYEGGYVKDESFQDEDFQFGNPLYYRELSCSAQYFSPASAQEATFTMP